MLASLVNGQFTDTISTSDRGLLYGDGLFETLRISQAKPVFWAEHMARLERDSERLGIVFPGQQILAEEAQVLISQSKNRDEFDRGILKIILTRGQSERGYAANPDIPATRILSLSAAPQNPASYLQNGVEMRVCDIIMARSPRLAGIKHLNRLENVLARREWQDSRIVEGLLLDDRGFVIEGTMSNVFLVKDRHLMTPDLSQSGVAGVIREIILRIAGENRSMFKPVQKNLTLEDLYQADEVFICNSVIGIWPVARIEDHDFKVGKDGNPLTTELAESLNTESSTQ